MSLTTSRGHGTGNFASVLSTARYLRNPISSYAGGAVSRQITKPLTRVIPEEDLVPTELHWNILVLSLYLAVNFISRAIAAEVAAILWPRHGRDKEVRGLLLRPITLLLHCSLHLWEVHVQQLQGHIGSSCTTALSTRSRQ